MASWTVKFNGTQIVKGKPPTYHYLVYKDGVYVRQFYDTDNAKALQAANAYIASQGGTGDSITPNYPVIIPDPFIIDTEGTWNTGGALESGPKEYALAELDFDIEQNEFWGLDPNPFGYSDLDFNRTDTWATDISFFGAIAEFFGFEGHGDGALGW